MTDAPKIPWTSLPAAETGPEIIEDCCGPIGFRVVFQLTGDHWLDVRAYEITGRDEGGKPMFSRAGATSWPDDVEDIKDAEVYCTAILKWDACSHFYFTPADQGYIHMCGRESFAKHINLLHYLHKRAPELMNRDPVEWFGEPLLKEDV